MIFIGGAYAEEMGGDDASDVSDVESSMPSSDIVSSNYLTDSEVSDTPQVDGQIDYGGTDGKISSAVKVDKIKKARVSSCEEQDDEPIHTINSGDVLQMSCDSNGFSNQLTEVIGFENVLDALSISDSSQDYLTQDDIDAINAILADFSSDMETSDSYRLGKYVTRVANDLLDFESADDVLLITTAGTSKLNGETSEPVIEGIIDESAEYISYGKGNLLMLQKSDSLDFCFVVKRGNALNAVVFLNGSNQMVYSGTISEMMSNSDWKKFSNAVGAENALSFASLANGWNDGVPFELLQEAAFQGKLDEGNIYGYAVTNVLLQYYPPIKENNVGNQSGDIPQYTVLSIPGNSATDTVIYFLDATSGKSSYVGFNTASTGATKDMVGIIEWNGQTNNGNIIVMEYDSDANKKLFKKETGTSVKNGLSKLRYNTWLFRKAYNNPNALVDILIEKSGLSEKQYLYLVGSNGVNDGNGYANSHGLDYKYIKNLNLPKAVRNDSASQKGTLDYDDFMKIGVEAAEKAKSIYNDELGIQINDTSDIMVLTSAGYVLLNGQSTEGCWDGLFDVLGTRLSRNTLLPVHQAIWSPLWFNFILKQSDGSLMSIYMRYNEEDDSFFIGDYNGTQTYNLNMSTLNDSALSAGIRESAYPDGNYFGIESISNAWSDGIQFDQLMSILYHNNACEGIFPGFFMADYIMRNIPLDKSQSYTYVANSQNCKDDSLQFALDLSPSLGNYLVQRLTGDECKGKDGSTEQGILVIWDSAKKIGYAVAVNYQWQIPDLSNYATSESKSAALVKAFIDQSKGESNPIVDGQKFTFSDGRWITQSQFKKIKAGGDGSSLKYLKGLGYISKKDLLKAIAAKTDKKKDKTNKSDETKKDTNHNEEHGEKHKSHYYAEYHAIDRVNDGIDAIEESHGMLDNSTEDGNATLTPDDGSVKRAHLRTPTNFNTLIFSLMGVFVLAVLFGISHRRQEN